MTPILFKNRQEGQRCKSVIEHWPRSYIMPWMWAIALEKQESNK